MFGELLLKHFVHLLGMVELSILLGELLFQRLYPVDHPARCGDTPPDSVAQFRAAECNRGFGSFAQYSGWKSGISWWSLQRTRAACAPQA